MSKSLLRPALLGSAVIASPAIIHAVYDNTLTRLYGDLYQAVDVVSRELVGFIPSVFRNVGAERAAVGQAVVYPVTDVATLVDVTPAMAIPEPADIAVGNGTITITKSKAAPFGWTGEQQRALNTGVGYLSVQGDLFAQALRTLTNAIELDLAVEAAANASRWTGTPGTTPFATDLGAAAQVRKILDDNGAPASERSLVVDTTAGAAMRTLKNLVAVNESGTTMTLRDGQLLDLAGLSVKESAQVQQTKASTGASATTNAVGYAKGAKVITLASAGTGNLNPGSTITFAGDTNQYNIVAGDTDVSNGGTITLAEPGLRVAIPAAATAITVVAVGTANVGFSRNALHLVARAPALPQEGDAAIDRMQITDVRSGMVFEISLYAGYRKIRAEVAAAWGVKAVKREHIAGLFG